MNGSFLTAIFDRVRATTESWNLPLIGRPWFRGHEDARWKLIPSILRNANLQHEFDITRRFRLLAPSFGVDVDRDRIDQWLFIMQHHGAPTRLLDWTESLFTGVFFACLDWINYRDIEKCTDGAVYALNPLFLNESVADLKDWPITWTQGTVLQTIKFAFGTQDEEVLIDGKTVKYKYLREPVAILPTTVHPRMRAQRSCFTLHGADGRDMKEIFDEKGWTPAGMLTEYPIPRDVKPSLSDELVLAGISYSTVFPDLENLCRDLRYEFRIER